MTDVVMEGTAADARKPVEPEAQHAAQDSAPDDGSTETVNNEDRAAEADNTSKEESLAKEESDGKSASGGKEASDGTEVSDSKATTIDPENTIKEETIAQDGKETEKVDVKADEEATTTANDKSSTMLKTKQEQDAETSRNKSKYDPSTLPETDDPVQIRAQVEFYMGDSNLPQDKFMWTLTGGAENKPVDLSVICNFKRMRRFTPYSAVVAALRDSKVLIVEGEDGKETIKRKTAYQMETERSKIRIARSVYVKGFGDEEPDTQFKLEAFFQKFGAVESVRLRRTDKNLFKGSAFVEFQSEQAAADFLAVDPSPTWEGHDLKIMAKRAYIEEKNKLIMEGVIQPSNSRFANSFWQGQSNNDKYNKKKNNGNGNNQSKNGDRDDWNNKRDRDQKDGRNGGGHGGPRGRGRGGDRGWRGRGGRGRGRGGHRDRNESRSANDKGDAVETTKDTAKETSTEATAGDKRPREDDAGAGAEAPAAKKVDVKEEPAAAEA